MHMTIEEVKEELLDYKNDCKLINSIEDQLDFYTSKLTSCTSQLRETTGGGGTVKDKLAEYICKLEELKAKKFTQLIELEQRKERVERIVMGLKQPYKTLLYITYLQVTEYEDNLGNAKTVIGHKQYEAAYLMNYEPKYFTKLHKKALVEYLKAREKNG